MEQMSIGIVEEMVDTDDVERMFGTDHEKLLDIAKALKLFYGDIDIRSDCDGRQHALVPRGRIGKILKMESLRPGCIDDSGIDSAVSDLVRERREREARKRSVSAVSGGRGTVTTLELAEMAGRDHRHLVTKCTNRTRAGEGGFVWSRTPEGVAMYTMPVSKAIELVEAMKKDENTGRCLAWLRGGARSAACSKLMSLDARGMELLASSSGEGKAWCRSEMDRLSAKMRHGSVGIVGDWMSGTDGKKGLAGAFYDELGKAWSGVTCHVLGERDGVFEVCVPLSVVAKTVMDVSGRENPDDVARMYSGYFDEDRLVGADEALVIMRMAFGLDAGDEAFEGTFMKLFSFLCAASGIPQTRKGVS